jgi:perosamine synthetase
MAESVAMIPYGRQLIEDDDVEAVTRALRSDFLTTGPEVEAFERELADACGAAHAVVVANGTAALHCAYAAAGLGSGDEIVTTPFTFAATSNMALALGAKPVFADVDARTLNLDPDRAEAAITERTRVLAPVDFAGHPADIDAFMRLAEAHKLIVVEDAAHAIGSKLRGRPVGSLAHMTTFSFHPVKTITTGEGGAVLTNDDELARRVRDFRNHGLVRDRSRLGRDDGGWYYEIQSLGLNYRLTDLQCALGRSQLRKLPRLSKRRGEIVARYTAAFRDDRRLQLPVELPDAEVTWHLYCVRLATAEARRSVYDSLRADGIAAQVHYVSVTDMPLYRARGYTPEATPIAARAAQTCLSLPLYPGLTDPEVDRVIEAMRTALDRA